MNARQPPSPRGRGLVTHHATFDCGAVNQNGDAPTLTEAAKTKGIAGAVAGDANFLVVPDIEAGNMLAKQLEYLAEPQVAGIVLGARVPIVLTSRADKTPARLASCALAVMLVRPEANADR